jgi:ubiquinone/menaquinone biosynthesis C-methylase UbiE
MMTKPDATWPKILPPLTPEQQWISDDFMKHWHQVLPGRYGLVNNFNHTYPVRHAPAGFVRTLEVGAGDGEHLAYERLSPEQMQNYAAIDVRSNMIAALRSRFPKVSAIVADCQKRMPFDDGHFDRIIAIHVLEHLPDLPAAVAEMRRVCHPRHGMLSVVIPCEGSLAYGLARRVSAQRIFEKRYRQPYKWFITREHINRPYEIFAELRRHFTITQRTYWPIPIPIETCNLCIGMTLHPS